MAKLDVSKIDLSLYPLVGTYRYPDRDSLAAPLTKALAVKGVSVSGEPRGASWASFATPTDGPFPTKELVARLRVHGLAADKKLGEALMVSYVLLDGDTIVAASEDHAFKPPRPARLALVDASGALVPITDALREAVTQISSAAPAKAAKPAKAKEAPAKAEAAPAKAKEAPAKAKEAPAKAKEAPAKAKEAPSKAKEAPAKANEAPAKAEEAPAKGKAASKDAAVAGASERFVFDLPLLQLVVSPSGDRLATIHAASRHVRVFGLDGVARSQIDAGGNGTNVARAAAFSPDGARLATGVSEVRIADATTGAELARVEVAKKAQITSLVWRTDGLFVGALTPKASLLVKLDGASFAPLGQHEWKREPGMPGDPLLDGGVAYMTLEAEHALARLDLAAGKTTRVAVGDRFPGGFTLEGVTSEGLWVRSSDGTSSPLHLLDRETFATRRVVELVALAPFHFAADGSGFAAGQSSADGDEVVWRDASGKERARFGHAEVPGLAARLTALAEARKNKDSLRYLRHEPRRLTQTIALAGDAIVLASDWTIAVHGRDGALRVATSG